jgi:hypothetical protein
VSRTGEAHAVDQVSAARLLDCYDDKVALGCDPVAQVYFRGLCHNVSAANETFLVRVNTVLNASKSSPAGEYFQYVHRSP